MERFLKPTFTKMINEENKETPNAKLFKIEKLERGFANTLGTSMRRALLSSIPSSAPFAIELKGASHEFQAMKDVKEDVAELILNLKELVLTTDMNIIEPDVVYELKLVSKEGIVKAKDIELPAGLEIVNKDLVIADTSKDKAIDMKIFVIFSKGFKTFEENRSLVEEKIGTTGVIPMDSNFSPIKRVNFKVSEVNPGESRVFEKLELDVETKGNMLPETAIAFAAAVLRNHFIAFEEESMSTVDTTVVDTYFEEEVILTQEDSQLMMSIEELNLSVRSANGLEKANINTVGELVDRPFSALKKIENLGDKSVSEIVEAISSMGLSFKAE
jgi:DNA-directed RNA polymerase subunit alpha